MKKIFIILPTQLFEINDYLGDMDYIYLIEEPFYFTLKAFHRQKLILHRASMKYYYDYLINKRRYSEDKIRYIEFDELSKIKKKTDEEFYMFDPIDNDVIEKYLKLFKIKKFYNTPAFLETREELEEYRNKYTNKKNYYHDRSFYRWQRKRLNILMKDNKTPINNIWSFDKENRNKYDKDYKENKIKIYNNDYIKEAKNYIIKNFNDNFGNIENFYYPITFDDVNNHLKLFIKNRLETFGKYQDGISQKVIFGSHSVLSPLLNIGLITPVTVIKKVLKYYKNNEDSKSTLITVEAFLRQLIGWRSYVRFIYIYHGNEMKEMNYLNHKNKIPKSWYDEKSESNKEIKIIDDMIKKVYEYAYLHHIERLMIMGNIGLLLQINPKELYEWFMICFIDSYEWVMIPNVYGMSQYSLTGISMMTRPYFSSSNYIKKMSDYKNEKWFKKWDDLYWNLLNRHKEIFKKIYSLANQIKLLDKKKR